MGLEGPSSAPQENMEQKFARIKAEKLENEAARAELQRQIEYIRGHYPPEDAEHAAKMREAEELNKKILELNAKDEALRREMPF